MIGRIHVIDPDVRRRARVSHELHTLPLHVEIYENIDEFLDLAPHEGVVLAADEPDDSGRQMSETIRDLDIGLPVVAYAESPSPEDVAEVMLAGACGYLEWPFAHRRLDATLHRLSSQGARRLKRERRLWRARALVQKLSRRETEVLTLLIGGLSNRKIGEALGISPRTIEIHRANMMGKLQAHTVADAVRIGLYAGLDESWDAPRFDEVA